MRLGRSSRSSGKWPKLSRHELRVEQRDSVASLTPSEEKVLKGGKAEETREEKWVGERLWRLRRNEIIGGGQRVVQQAEQLGE